MNAALYVRVSTQEQKVHGQSVDSQIDALIQYCEEREYTYTIYNDAGFSAAKKYTSRPALLRLLGDCKSGNIDIILFTRLDRWFRSVPDYYAVQTQLDECHVPWRTIWEDYETETSSGIFKVNIMLSIAQAEAQRTSEKIKSVLEYRRAQGDFIGSAPLGYVKSHGQLMKDESCSEALDAFFQTYLTTLSGTKATESARKYGVYIDLRHLHRMLRNTAYSGDAHGYKCEPYITPEQQKILIDTIKAHPRKNPTNRTYIFSRLCYCSVCGHAMAGQMSTRGVPFYRCPSYQNPGIGCKGMQIREYMIEDYLLENLKPTLDKFKIDLKARKSQKGRDAQLKRKNSLTGKLERLKSLFVDGDISREDYVTKRDALQAELDSIVIDEPSEVFQLSSDWKEIYAELDREHKQLFWSQILDRIIISKRSPKPVFKKYLNIQ